MSDDERTNIVEEKDHDKTKLGVDSLVVNYGKQAIDKPFGALDDAWASNGQSSTKR